MYHGIRSGDNIMLTFTLEHLQRNKLGLVFTVWAAESCRMDCAAANLRCQTDCEEDTPIRRPQWHAPKIRVVFELLYCFTDFDIIHRSVLGTRITDTVISIEFSRTNPWPIRTHEPKRIGINISIICINSADGWSSWTDWNIESKTNDKTKICFFSSDALLLLFLFSLYVCEAGPNSFRCCFQLRRLWDEQIWNREKR